MEETHSTLPLPLNAGIKRGLNAHSKKSKVAGRWRRIRIRVQLTGGEFPISSLIFPGIIKTVRKTRSGYQDAVETPGEALMFWLTLRENGRNPPYFLLSPCFPPYFCTQASGCSSNCNT